MKAYAYHRVSTDKQGKSGLGLEAQERATSAWCETTAYEYTPVVEVESAAKSRPELEKLLASMEAGDVLVVLKLDRLGRSVTRVLDIIEKLERRGCGFVALDIGVDSTKPAGRLVLTVLAAIAEWERGIISERTTAALAAKRALDPESLKRPDKAVPEETVKLILRKRKQGKTLRTIAAELRQERVPTARGDHRQWQHGTVAYLLKKHAA